MPHPPSDEDLDPPRKSKRGAVVIFLLGWLALPIFVVLLGERDSPWYEIGCAAMLAFIAVWFGLNLLFGMGTVSVTGEDQSVAWQAHVGGFVAGLLLFGLFDPVRAYRRKPPSPAA